MLDLSTPYFCFNREERHLAAVLFHLLCLGDNIERLIQSRGLGRDWEVMLEECGVYFEYSFLRDAWHRLGTGEEANAAKREIIRCKLEGFGATESLLGRIDAAETRELNGMFIGHPSAVHVQSPANWQLARFGPCEAGLERENVLAACKLKWAFKAKPDIVVQPSLQRALCLELKLESGEGSYPTDGTEKLILKKRGLYEPGKEKLPPIRQTALQRLMMEDLFGPDRVSVLLVTRNGPEDNDAEAAVSWAQLLAKLEIPATIPRFVQKALAAFSGPSCTVD